MCTEGATPHKRGLGKRAICNVIVRAPVGKGRVEEGGGRWWGNGGRKE